MCAASVKFPFLGAGLDIRCWGAVFLLAVMLGLGIAVWLGYHSPDSHGLLGEHALVIQERLT